MQFFATLISAALVATGVSAQKAVVNNDCDATIYAQSFPFDGSAAGPLTTLKPGEAFTETFRPSGSTIKLGTTKTLSAPLFMGYSFSTNPDYVYYEFSTEWGMPWPHQHNILTPGDGCQVFDCAADDASCYSTPNMKKVYGCPQPVNLTATICA
ncbi:hypothetical protein F4780DRAFT_201328 [Xylariomycetidae sp. FL0641]|nr:hypothetical protein F4780DRAFT_201328 [Xylariomycetidae sp. FL0641]